MVYIIVHISQNQENINGQMMKIYKNVVKLYDI